MASCLAVLARWHCLTWTCAAVVREFHVNQLKPWPTWCENPTSPNGENKLRCCQSCPCCWYCWGGHIAQRESPLVQLLLVRPQRQDACSLGSQPGSKGCKRGAKDAFHQYVTDLLKTAVQLTHHPSQLSLPPCQQKWLEKGQALFKQLFYPQVANLCSWSLLHLVFVGLCYWMPSPLLCSLTQCGLITSTECDIFEATVMWNICNWEL